MTVPNRTSQSNPLLDEALDWVVRLKTDEPTRAEVDALQRWREQSPAHDAALKNAIKLFRTASVAAHELADEQQAPSVVAAVSQPRPRPLSRRLMLGGAIAAAAAGYMVVRPPLGLWPSCDELSADYRTGKGEHRRVAIAPDVSLELNTQTSVALRDTPGETRIELISGEASVAAKSSPSRPLVMLAGSGRISASQADFNARCLDGVVSVTCLDGVVTVEQNHSTVELHKAEQVTYSSAGLQRSVSVDAVQVAAWQAGQLVFRDRPLASVVDEVNRYRPGRIIITNAELKGRLVNGTFQLDKLGNFVDQVEQLFGARITALPGGVVLLS